MSFETDKFLLRHGVFVRSARDVAHQVLFFLGMLEPTTKEPYKTAVEDYWQPAMHQVMGLVHGVYVPTAHREAEARLDESGVNWVERRKAVGDLAKRLGLHFLHTARLRGSRSSSSSSPASVGRGAPYPVGVFTP